MIYPISALRALALHTQRLTAPYPAKPYLVTPAITAAAIVDLVEALGFVQIDSLHVVNRAHYVTLWSRFGSYNTADFDRLIYTPGERRLYEGWGHAASIISLDHYRYHRWRISSGFSKWLSKDDNRALAEQTLARIRAEGGLRVADFETAGLERGPWFDWQPPKMALEALFAHGDLMVAERVNFHRVYDLRERVLPGWVDTTPVTASEGRRFCLEQAARALGVFDLRSLTWYAYSFATPARPVVKALVKSGALVEIQGESSDGVRTWLVHRDHLALLQRAADGEIKAERTTFLDPFDSLFWAGSAIKNCGASTRCWSAISGRAIGSTAISVSRSCIKTAWLGVLIPNWSGRRVCCSSMRFILSQGSNPTMSWSGQSPSPCAIFYPGTRPVSSGSKKATPPGLGKNC